MVAISFIAPSISNAFAIFCTNAILQVISYFLIWKKSVNFADEPGLLDQVLFWETSMFFLCVLFFTVLQKRELKQFFLYEELKKKQEQMTSVFDAQSDAVVIMGQETSLNETIQQDYELVEHKLPEFMFNNSKSTELFGIDLQNLQNQKTQVAESFLDEQKFVCLDTKSKDH